jgi:hypothetical protein
VQHQLLAKAFRRSGLGLSREAADALLEFVCRYGELPLAELVDEVLNHLRIHSATSSSHIITEPLLRPVLMAMEPQSALLVGVRRLALPASSSAAQ